MFKSFTFSSLKQDHAIVLSSSILLTIIYGYFAFFITRSDFFVLIFLYALAFVLTFFILQKSTLKFMHFVFLAILIRLIFLIAVPSLSQDFFRFFWDGQLVLNGINPYLYSVDLFFDNGMQDQIATSEILREGMGKLNASHFSNYPPFSQMVYAFSAWVAGDSILLFIICLRLVLIGFDILFIIYARKILKHFNKNQKLILWYIMCPLTILEVTANLHLEGIMTALFVMSYYYLLKNKIFFSTLFLSLSITTKLLSVLIIPFLFKHLFVNSKKTHRLRLVGVFGSFIIIITLIQFAFFYNPILVDNYGETLALWFNKFEFNASIYFIIRWIGYKIVGYNIIQTYGVWMPIVFMVLYFTIWVKKKVNLDCILEIFMWILITYFLLSTTIHPWYILFPLSLSIFTRFTFVYVWSFLVFLSYYYYHPAQDLNPNWFISLEYVLLLGYMFYEIAFKKSLFKWSFKENISKISSN